MLYCTHCGAENSDKARFCIACGKPVAAAPQGSTLPLQTVLRNQYLVLKQLGQGGMGAVYLAQDQAVFNRFCVVKEMLPYFTTPAERQQAEQNFEREARLLASLRNPRIPQVYAYFIENGHGYLVMEWVEGENLEERLAQQGGPLAEPDVLDYALQLVNILVYTAKQNPPVIHRDIKPANIIVGDDGQVKLVDFGIAKTSMGTGQSSKMSMPLGTQGYAPPEQYSGLVEPRTDVYALGATLHHMLTGRDPRNEAPFQFPPVRSLAPGVSPELEKLLGEMLQVDPALRPTAVQVRARLEALLTPQTVGGSQFQPFVFRAGAIAANLHELALACDKHWDEAVEHLYNGDFEPWLAQINRSDLVVRAGSIKRRGGDRSAGLEEFIRAIDHTMMMPALAVDQNMFDLGTVERGERHTVTVQLMNAGRGYLHGEIKNSAPWVRVTPRSFGLREGQQTPLTVTIDTGSLNEGPIAQTILEATSNGGLAVVAVKADITWQPQLEIEPPGKLDFGAVVEGQEQPVTTVFTVRNAGGSVLSGQLMPAAPWIQLDQYAFSLSSGAELAVTATADPSWLGVLTAQEGLIRISSSIGTLEKPALVRVQKVWYVGWSRISSWLLYGLLVLLGYVGAAIPLSVGLAILLGWPRPGSSTLAVLAGFLLLSPLAFFLSRRLAPRLDEIEDYHYRGRLADALTPSVFSVRKLAWLTGLGVIFGGLLGWWYGGLRPGDVNLLWGVIGGLVGGLAGTLLALEGDAASASGGSGWGGASWIASPTYAIVRSLLLLLAGGLLSLMAGALFARGGIRPVAAMAGALTGLLMSSESHRWLGLRLRWLLQHARVGAWAILGTYVALSIVSLLWWRVPWTLSGYGVLNYAFAGLVPLLWLLLYIVVALLGALGGLWAADGAGQPLAKAPRLLVGLAGVQLGVTLPVYLILSGVTTSLRGSAHMWINLLAMLIAAGTVLWALRFRRAQVGAAIGKTNGALVAGWDRVAAALPGALSGIWHRLFQTRPALPGKAVRLNSLKRIRLPGAATVGRWRAALASLTLGELSSEMTLPLAIGATGVSVLIQHLLASFLVMLTVGLGTVLLYALLLAVAIIVLMLVVRYLRNR